MNAFSKNKLINYFRNPLKIHDLYKPCSGKLISIGLNCDDNFNAIFKSNSTRFGTRPP